MKSIHSFSLVAVLSCLTISNLYGTSKSVLDSKIEQVTIYLNGGEVLRKGSLSIKKGINEITLPNLAGTLIEKSFNLTLDEGARIVSISAEENVLILKDYQERVKDLNDSLKLIGLAYSEIENKLKAANSARDMILKNGKIDVNSDFNKESIQRFTSFYYDEVFKLNQTVSELEREFTTFEQIKERLELQLKELNYIASHKSKDVKVIVYSETDDIIETSISYLVSNTAWVARYDLVATDQTDKIKLKYNAKLYNDTGENWENVKILLSTADPLISASVPDLKPWYIKHGGQRKQASYRPVSNIDLDANLKYKAVAIPDMQTTFEIENTHTVLSDKNVNYFKVKEFDLETKFQRITIPKKDMNVFIVGKITGWEKLSLVEGDANIYFKDNYVGSSTISTSLMEDTLELSFGRDRSIQVERIKMKEFSSKSIIGNNRKDTYSYSINIKNNNSLPLQIEVRDQIPVSTDSEVEVGIIELSNAKLNEQTGILKWEINVNENSTKTLKLGYWIKYAKGKPRGFIYTPPSKLNPVFN